MLYQRRNIRGSQLKIGDLSNYRGKRILVMTGTADADHPRKLDEGIVTWLNEHGAKADFIYLGDRGITGNGHMVLENNSTALAHQIGLLAPTQSLAEIVGSGATVNYSRG